jgi:hypothetical protein
MVRDPWSDCLLKAEHYHQVRETRLGYERVERLLVTRFDRDPWLIRLTRLLHLNASRASGLEQAGHTGSLNEQRQQCVVVAMPTPARARAAKPTSRSPQADRLSKAA